MVKKAGQATPNGLLRAARKERGWSQQQVADRIGAPLSLNVSRWENGMAFPSAYYVERLCQLFGKSVRELGLSQLAGQAQDVQTPSQAASHDPVLHPLSEPAAVSSPSSDQHDRVRPHPDLGTWMLPYPRNPFFLGREEVLTRLRRQLQGGQPMALSGLGGVGKTHVALEYAYRHAQDYQAVFWTRADSRDALVTGSLEMAHALDLPQRDERDQSAIVAAVKGWLSQHTGWLLILDNADELALLPEFLPAPLRGHLLLTTRAQALGRLATRIEVETLDSDTAALLLLRRADLLALDAPLAQAEQADRQVAVHLSRELGGLPLALDQAGAYLEETGCGLQQYLELYRSHRVELLRRRGGVVQDHPDSVATTWALSFASVQSRSALAADLLRLCAVLHPDAIPEELFLQGAAHLGPALAALESDPLAVNQALAVIGSYSLLRRSPREHTFSMHRLVQAVLADAMTNQERVLWTERAIAAFNAVFPEVRSQGWDQWKLCGRLLQHVLIAAAAIPTEKPSLQLAALLTRAADYLFQRAQYEQAEPLYQRALFMSEQMPGSKHPEVAFPLNGLADVYREQGRYEQAEPLYQRALRIWETFSQEYPEMPSPLNDLAILYQQQGRYQQAELLLQRDLSLKEQTLGSLHPRLATPLNNLAVLYCQQGRYQQAHFLYQQALAIREQRLGPEHPHTLDTRTRCARLLRASGRSEEAVALAEERSITAAEVIVAQRPAPTPSPSAKLSLASPDGLTAREVDVLRLVAQGLSDAHIAERLIISPRTVNNHLTSIYSKIQVSSRAAATRYAFEHRLV